MFNPLRRIEIHSNIYFLRHQIQTEIKIKKSLNKTSKYSINKTYSLLALLHYLKLHLRI